MPLPEVLRQILLHMLTPDRLAVILDAILVLALVLVAAWIAQRLSVAIIRRAGARIAGYPGRTLTPVFESAARYAIGFAAFVAMLQALRINVTGVIASAGVVGVALGFGAQYIIRDILAGMFLLAEGVIEIGDLVRINGDLGNVERITLRSTQIRKFSGELLTIPNGAIGKIGNLSRNYGRAIVQITVPYRADLNAALDALQEVGRTWAAGRPEDALEEPVVDGTVDLKDAGAVVQLSVLVRPGRQGSIEADLRRRILEAFAGRGIRIDTRISATIDPQGPH
jgi:small conductance mechanosensitive channel